MNNKGRYTDPLYSLYLTRINRISAFTKLFSARKMQKIISKLLKIKYTFFGKTASGRLSGGSQKGFILIQIDGLPYSAIMKAMGKGYVPTIRKLVNKRGFTLLPYFCPMPSNTPYVQTGMMYGNNEGVMGFRWMEKKEGKRVTFKDAASAALIEERVSRGRTGILTGGSSYLNLFSGGAERSVFTLSTFAAGQILEKKKIGQLDIFIIFILYITNIIRTLGYLLTDSILELYEWMTAVIFRKKRRGEGLFPIIRLINNVIFREVETVGAIADIVNGVPSIHITFNGYDEISHHRGPEYRGAFRVLRGIDRKVKKIVRAARTGNNREYDLFIFADHGQTPSTPFLYRYGETLAGLIQRTTPEELEITEFNSPQEVVFYEGWKYMEELGFLTINVPLFVYNTIESLRARLTKDKPQIIPFVWRDEKEQVFVNDSCSLSHIYFNFNKEQIAFDDIREKYKDFIDALTSHPGIGVIIGHQVNGEGTIVKWDDKLKVSDRELFLGLAKDKNAGDIIVQGKFDGKEIINFEEQLSGHGGLGGDQNRPFFLLPPGCTLDVSKIKDPKDFYPFFYENYTKKTMGKVGDESS